MRDPARIDPLIDLLRDIMHANPDLRLGQIVCIGGGQGGNPPFYVEDDKMAENLREIFTKTVVEYSCHEETRDCLTHDGVTP